MFNHKVFRGQNKFKLNKKTLILVIKKQPGEIDWILPILNEIKKDVNIIVIFEKKNCSKIIKRKSKIIPNF